MPMRSRVRPTPHCPLPARPRCGPPRTWRCSRPGHALVEPGMPPRPRCCWRNPPQRACRRLLEPAIRRALLALGTPVEAIAAAERGGRRGWRDGHLAPGAVRGRPRASAERGCCRGHRDHDAPARRPAAGRSGGLARTCGGLRSDRAISAAKAIMTMPSPGFRGYGELFRGRSIVDVRLGQLEAAAADASEAARLAPGWLEPRFLLGDIERARGQATAAEEAFRAARRSTRITGRAASIWRPCGSRPGTAKRR